MPILTPKPKSQLLESQKDYIMSLFRELEIDEFSAVRLMNEMFNKPNLESLSVMQATKLVEALNTYRLFRKPNKSSNTNIPQTDENSTNENRSRKGSFISGTLIRQSA